MFLLMQEVPAMIQLLDEQLNNLGKEALVVIVSSLQDQLSQVSSIPATMRGFLIPSTHV